MCLCASGQLNIVGLIIQLVPVDGADLSRFLFNANDFILNFESSYLTSNR